MRAQEAKSGQGSMQLRAARFDLVLRAVLVAAMWSVLRLLGGDLTSFVSVAVIAAIFGPDALRAGREWLSSGVDQK